MHDSPDAVVDLCKSHAKRRTLVVTGAGIGPASGIPTFRGPDEGAIWKKDVTELGTFRYFGGESPI